MTQTKNIVVVVALLVGFGAGFITRPIIAPTSEADAVATFRAATPSDAPRAVQYFEAHLHDARGIVAGCQSGAVRGAECINAGQAVAEAEGKERFRKFVGN